MAAVDGHFYAGYRYVCVCMCVALPWRVWWHDGPRVIGYITFDTFQSYLG